MSISILHKTNNSKFAGTYKWWNDEIVEKGLANEFLILRYPDIVQLQTIDAFGKKSNDRLMERISAENLKKKNPETYDFMEIDVKKQIQNDIKRSMKIQSSSSFLFLNNSGKIQKRINIKPIIGAIIQAIISLSPIWKIILGIIIAGLGALLGYILIELYISFQVV